MERVFGIYLGAKFLNESTRITNGQFQGSKTKFNPVGLRKAAVRPPPPDTIETSQKIFVSGTPALKSSKPTRILKTVTKFAHLSPGTQHITDGYNISILRFV
jgi:hypothetical protein